MVIRQQNPNSFKNKVKTEVFGSVKYSLPLLYTHFVLRDPVESPINASVRCWRVAGKTGIYKKQNGLPA